MKLTQVENESVGVNREKSDVDSRAEMAPSAAEHSGRFNAASKYVKFVRKNAYLTAADKKIDVIFGVTRDGKSEIQAYRYPQVEWEAAAARDHCRAHGGSFAAASGETAWIEPSLEEKAVGVHTKAVENVKACIRAGRVNTADRLKFGEADRQKMLGEKGDNWAVYGSHHLGVDMSKPADTRMAYTHPVVKDGMVYKKALDACAGDDNKDIAAAAKALAEMCGE
jgi:hypothetical protein